MEPPNTITRPPMMADDTCSRRGGGGAPSVEAPLGSVEPVTYSHEGARLSRSRMHASEDRRRTGPAEASPPYMSSLLPPVTQRELPRRAGGRHPTTGTSLHRGASSPRSQICVSLSRCPDSLHPPKITSCVPRTVQLLCHERGEGGDGTATSIQQGSGAARSSRWRSLRLPWAEQPPKSTTHESLSHRSVCPHRPFGSCLARTGRHWGRSSERSSR
mmetsp:Transcript_56433/g.178565  ORF Transcript_56433/g.178565 Transcript_56433/m.178565 type:complete len:216 (-) Transcript_56433:1080-1727(-)